MKKRLRVASALLRIVLMLVTYPSLAASGVTLQQSRFDPGQPHSTLLTVSSPGTITIRVQSTLGAEIILEDRMTGVLARDGAAGTKDGRIDYTLDAGEYRVRAVRSKNDQGTVQISALQLKEVNTLEEQGMLIKSTDGALVSTTLRDGEQKSFWVHHDAERKPLILEAAGRSLRSIQLWKDGQLLVEERPFFNTIAPEPGKSLIYAEFNFAESSRNLPTGDYLAVFVAGQMLPWEQKGNDQPLYIRKGMKSLGSAWIGTVQLSPFGFEHFTATGDFRVEAVPSNTDAVGLSVGQSPGDGIGSRWNSVAEESESSITARDVTAKEQQIASVWSAGSERSWIRISGRPGTRLELRIIPARAQVSLSRGKQYLVTGIASSSLRNSLDLTGLCVSDNRIVQDSAVELGGKKPIVRMTGIRDMQGMFIRVTEKGSYRIFEDDEVDGSAEYAFMRVGQGTKAIIDEENTWSLEEDLYYLTVKMKERKPGILRFAVVKSGFLSFAQIRSRGLFKQPDLPMEGFTFQNVSGGYNENTMVKLGIQDEEEAGLAVYELPLDAKEPVVLFLAPGAEVSIPARDRMTALSARSLTSVDVSSTGQYTLRVQNRGKVADFVILEPDTSKPQGSVPAPLSLGRTLPKLTAEKPVYRDYRKNETVQFIISVDKPGYYALETTGRLKTSLTVRTYVRPSLFSSSTGGSGRNARVVAYLSTGDYLAEVKIGSTSAGRAGLKIEPVQRKDGGVVMPGDVLRTELAEGEGCSFTLSVETPGYYRIQADSLGVSHVVRVEDAAGWLISSGTDVRVMFEAAGLYTVHSLPSDAPHRRRFQVVKEPDPVPKADPEKGIIELPLNSSMKAVWNEREPRFPHCYAVHIPSDAEVSFSLSKEMTYRILKDGSVVGEGLGDEKALNLSSGDYRIEVSAREKESGRPYTIGISTEWLMPGIPQSMEGQNASFRVSVPKDGIYDIESLSSADLIAALYDSSDKLVASNDDRRLDWDFLISSSLSKGLYTLSVSRIFGSSASARIMVTPRLKRECGTVSVPLSAVYKAGREILSLTFTAQDTGIYTLSADHPAVDGVSIERDNTVLASGRTGVYIPLVKGRNYRATIVVSSAREAEIPVSLNLLRASVWNLKIDETSSPDDCFKLLGSGSLSYTFASTGRVLFASGEEKQMTEVMLYPRSLSGGTGWLLCTDRNGKPQDGTVRARVARADDSGFVALPDEYPTGFLFSGKKDTVTVLRAETREALIGINLVQVDRVPIPASRSSAIRAGESVAAVYGDTDMAGILWNADRDRGVESVRVNIERYGVSAVEGWRDTATIDVPPLSAVRIEAPERPVDVSLLLARGIIFLDMRKGESEVRWADRGNSEEHIRIAGPHVFAINTTEKPLLVRLVRGSAEEVPSIKAGEAWRGVVAGKEQVRIESSGTWLFFGEGFSSPPVLFGDDGSIRMATVKGSDLFCIDAVPGMVSLEGSGLVQIQAMTMDDLYGHLVALGERTLLSAAKERRSGWASGLPSLKPGKNRGTGWFSLTVDKPSFVRIRSEGGGFLSLFGEVQVQAFREKNPSVSAYTDTGTYPVYWNPLLRDSELLLDVQIPEPFPGEEKVRFIDADEEHLYSFTVSEEAPVGVGIRAERDECECKLFDTSFREIAKGPFIYRTLPRGNYLVIVGGAKGPVQYIPLLYGNSGTLSDIPEAIKQSYKEEADE